MVMLQLKNELTVVYIEVHIDQFCCCTQTCGKLAFNITLRLYLLAWES